MTDNQGNAPNVTIVERRGSGGFLIAFVLLVGIVVAAFFLFNQQKSDTAKTEAVTAAAQKVGDAAKDVGDSAKKAVDQ